MKRNIYILSRFIFSFLFSPVINTTIYADDGNRLATSTQEFYCWSIFSAYDDFVYGGTVEGYSKCLERNKNQGLKIDVIEKMCKEKNQISQTLTYEGRAGYDPYIFNPQNPPMWEFSGYILNKSRDFVITSFKLNIRHLENIDLQSGQITIEKHEFHNVWIEPGAMHSFKIVDLKFKPALDKIETKHFSWYPSDFFGLKVELK